MVVYRTSSRASVPSPAPSYGYVRSPTFLGSILTVERTPSRVGDFGLPALTYSSSSASRYAPVGPNYGRIAEPLQQPQFKDRYPHTRYACGSGSDTGVGVVATSPAVPNYPYSPTPARRSLTSRNLETSSPALYTSTLYSAPFYGSVTYETRPRSKPVYPAPTTPLHESSSAVVQRFPSSYSSSSSCRRPSRYALTRYSAVSDAAPGDYKAYAFDHALSLYKKRFVTSAALSKYWLGPSSFQSRREKEWALSMRLPRESSTAYHTFSRSRY